MEIRLDGCKVQVPNNVAWDAKLQSIKGLANNESQSIISCLEHNGTNKECRHKMICLHTKVALEFMNISEDHEPTLV